MSKTYDVFLSYARQDKEALEPLLEALRDVGLDVWFDQSAVESFSAVSQTVGDGLSLSKALLAFYSRTYPTRRACQWELTAGYVAAQRLGEPYRRILVVNPESGSRDHIQPTSLRDTLLPLLPGPDDVVGMRAVAEAVRERVATLQGTLGEVGPMVAPRWHPTMAFQSPRFVGRVPDLWRMHSELHAAEYPLTSGRYSAPVFLSGFGGIGKTLLAEEYALRFGAAYPGGIFWLRAFGGDPTRMEVGSEMRESERDRQIREIARSLGLRIDDLPLTQVRGAVAGVMESAAKSALWVVDDLPGGLSPDDVRGWLAPHPLAATLVTTRSREYEGIGTLLQPGVLPADEAYDLLTHRRKPSGAAEEEAAHSIVAELGSHALALDVAGAALHWSHDRTFTEFLVDLRDLTYDELELASELAPVLPTERKEGIAAMLGRSVAALSPTARNVLAIASMLPPSPIPDAIIIETLAQIEGGDSVRKAKHRARRALAETNDRSLTERAGEGARAVHPLILRIVRFSKEFDRSDNPLRRFLVDAVLHALMPLNNLPFSPSDTDLMPHARALAQTIQSGPDADLANEVAEYDHRQGLYASAAEFFSRRVAYFSATIGEEDPVTLSAMNDLAVSIEEGGDFAGARALKEQVLEARRRVLGGNHPDTLGSLNNLAVSLSIADPVDLESARLIAEEAVTMCRQALGTQHSHTLSSMSTLATILGLSGDFERARAMDEEVLQARKRLFGDEHPETLKSMHNLAVRFAQQGTFNAARELNKQVAEIRSQFLGSEHPSTLTSMHNLAVIEYQIGSVAEARRVAQLTLDGRTRVLGNGHPDTQMTSKLIALIEHGALKQG